METHSIVSISKGIDGQLGIKMKNYENDMIIGIIAFYLSPDSYLYGQDAEHFFTEAAVLWEDFLDCDLLVGTGDLNARIRSDLDFIPDIDGHIPPRHNPDNSKNPHGNQISHLLEIEPSCCFKWQSDT